MNQPVYRAIVAMTSDRVIGRDGSLPWHLPVDLKFFKRTTTGHAILMGRKTWDSIGRPLPGRRNIVLSRSNPDLPEGVDLITDLPELEQLELTTDVYVIGGAEIYALLLPRCEELLVTSVSGSYPGDTWFPEFEPDFELVEEIESHPECVMLRYRRVAA